MNYAVFIHYPYTIYASSIQHPYTIPLLAVKMTPLGTHETSFLVQRPPTFPIDPRLFCFDDTSRSGRRVDTLCRKSGDSINLHWTHIQTFIHESWINSKRKRYCQLNFIC
jgi:hypothetical protein